MKSSFIFLNRPLESDPHRSCRLYSEETYEDCDLGFIQSELRENYHAKFIPIWSTSNFSAVTTLYVNKTRGFTSKFENILTGTQNSGYYCETLVSSRTIFTLGCLLPCVETHIKTVFIDEKSTDGTKRRTSTRFDIAFSTTVKTYVNDFPKFNFASFLAATGGAIGIYIARIFE